MAENKDTKDPVLGAIDESGPANVPDATTFDPSGAPVQESDQVDPSHPAVDNNPRAGTTVNQNKIDFNDPGLDGQEAVQKNLESQGISLASGKPTDK